MIKYGMERAEELKFAGFEAAIERRDSQWIDIVLKPQLDEATPVPDDLIEFSILVICTRDGIIAQMVPQDEGCDCEYGFTVGEKEQIAAYIRSEAIQSAISQVGAPQEGKLW